MSEVDQNNDEMVFDQPEDGHIFTPKEAALPSEKKQALVKIRLEAKAEFEKEKAEIEANIPEHIQKLFNEPGFAAWKDRSKKSWLPALVLSPFQIPTGTPRNIWLKMYNNLKRQDRLDKMTLMVSWYGYRESPLYNLVPLTDFVTYEVGAKKNYHALENTSKTGKVTRKSDAFLVAMEEMRDDLEIERVDRKGPHEPIGEEWEFIGIEALKDIKFSEVAQEEKPKSTKAVAKKKSGKKRKASEAGDKAPSKKVKSAAKKKDESSCVIEGSLEVAEIDFAEKESSDEVMEEEIPSDDESNDEDYRAERKAGSTAQEEDDVLDNVVPEVGIKKGSKPKKGVKAKAVKVDPKFKARDWQRKNGLQRIFEQNEQDFCPILEKWRREISNGNTSEVNRIVVGLTDRIQEMCPPFIEQYEIARSLKASKKVLQEVGEDISAIKTCRQKFQSHYTEKLALVPKTFTAMKKGEPTDQPSDSKKPPVEKKVSDKKVEIVETPKPRLSVDAVAVSEKHNDIPKRSQSSQSLTKVPRSVEVPVKPAAKPKQERKSFSLGTFISKPKDVAPPPSTTASKIEKRVVPQWMIGECSIVEPVDEDRSLALEFFRQMAEHFPKNKVMVETMARSIEKALYDWSCVDEKWDRPKYWERVHMLVACVCGKHTRTGTLMNLLLNGDFEKPEKLVELDIQVCNDSFEGRPIFL